MKGLATMTNAPWAQALLTPRSVALVGVSDDPAKTSGRPLQFLRRAGFGGKVWPVNPARATVQGETAYARLADLPAVPDHVFVLTGADRALDTLEDCVALGVPVVTMLAAGFAEAGARGAAAQARLAEITARATGRVRLLGPSSIGIVNLHHNLVLTANAAFAEPDLPRGGVFVASHSGSLIGALVSRGKRKGLGFAGLVSVGGEADLSLGAICMAALDDPAVTGFALFLESLRHADDLRRFALEAARRGKPVAAYKLGRSEAAAELAVSHTGALAGDDAVADVFLRDCGIARVDSFEALLEVMPLLAQVPPAEALRAGRVGVVTTTGGGAAMAVDRMALRGVDVVAPSDATRAKLSAAGVDPGEGRIVDLTLAGTRYDVMKSALDVLRAAPEFDMVLATVGSSARFNPELAVQPALDSHGQPGSPLGVFLVPDAPEAARLLAGAGVPMFQTPETCADAVAAALQRRSPRPPKAVAAPATPRPLSEAEAYARLAAHGVPAAPHLVLDADAPVPELPFAYPVAAKVLDPVLPHKSDAGGVVLNIADADALAQAMAQIRAHVARAMPGTVVRRILVQQMARGLGEVLLGLHRNPEVGPVVVVAAGGVFTELYRDSAMRLAPVDVATAREMIDELKITRILQGYRGGARGDLAALAETVAAFSRLAGDATQPVAGAEVNPLLVMPEGQGVLAVDAVMEAEP